MDGETGEREELEARRRRALQLLVEHGATPDELVEFDDDLGYLAAQLVNGGRPTMTRRELADRCGVELDTVDRLSLAAGIPNPGPDALSANENDVVLIQTFVAANALFGERTALQLARVVGAATAKMAEAISSVFRSVLAVEALDSDPSGLALVESNIALAELRPTFLSAVDQLLQRHVVAASRPTASASPVDSDTLAVAFVDIVGSTAMGARLSTDELSAVLGEFEAFAWDAVVAHGGRVVKLIGDEIMFTAPTAAAATAIGSEISSQFSDHPVIEGVRCAIALGSVIIRDGDCFGPVVNLAARLVAGADPGQVLVDAAMADAIEAGGGAVQALGLRSLKGIADDVPVFAFAHR